MARGGRQAPNPARAGQYTNRSDMRTTQAVQATSGGDYGDRAAQEAAQKAIPLQNAQGVQNQMAEAGAQSTFPGDLGAFDRPTDRPEEPLTTGVPIGMGAGPEALATAGMDDSTTYRLREMYAKFPSEGLRQLIEQMDYDL